MEDEYCNSLEGVGDGKDDSNPGEAGVEVEESREPADAKNTDQRHAALHLRDDLCLGVQVVVPWYRLPRHLHGHQEDDQVDSNHSSHRAHEGPDEPMLTGQPTVILCSITIQSQDFIADDGDDDND